MEISPNREVVMKAIDVLATALDSEDERVRVDAAISLLDHPAIHFPDPPQ